ncbi:hypothetical protein HGRIS_008406 [Hohenbuehelia grisea]|uniref:UBC core domain-containing protein n=1 Tax=Hohenbuehelia grisea TaxID=104357 RepID=A0ABR3J839_9AGAR
MPPRKRKSAAIELRDSPGSPKRARTRSGAATKAATSTVIANDGNDDDGDDFANILAQIKAQEESEALAKQLQSEWDTAGPSSSVVNGATTGMEVSEDDEAMARRLAAEWGESNQGSSADPIHLDAGATLKEKARISSDETPVERPEPARRLTLVDEVSPDERLAEFRELFTAERDCSKCSAKVPSPRGFVTFTSASPPSLLFLLHAPCKSCKTNHCRGCFKPISCTPACKGRPTANKRSKKTPPECQVLGCCMESRAIALFEILGGLDRQILSERATAESRALNLQQNKGKQAQSVGPGGTGYGTDGHLSYDASRPSTAKGPKSSRNEQLADHWDELISRALETLTTFLPSPYSEPPQTYDLLPHLSLPHLLSASQLPDVLGGLLRNDSVTDWINRMNAYQSMLALLRRMADCELTVAVLIKRRWEMKKSCGLETWMWDEGEIEWERKDNSPDGPIVRGKSLLQHFEKLTKQCEAFLAGASQMMDSAGGDDQEVEETMMKGGSLCGDIVAAKGDIERAMNVLGALDESGSQSQDEAELAPEPEPVTKGKGGRKGKQKQKAPSEKIQKLEQLARMEKEYRNACEELAFKHVSLCDPDTGKYSYYNYHAEVAESANATRLPKDRLHLIKELAVMATSLPPGIWVRVDEVRNDVIKVMIAGPEGTPYANGLFEFDCFMPLVYPNKPPFMHLRTTGDGSVRFNPNLYNRGKVCLSLLGTWAGRPEEQWSPKSTLLQVLISVQSMILIDTPWYNEPGRGQAEPTSEASIGYNKAVSFQTARLAIVDWLKDEHRNGIWADVIASHFTIRNSQISEQLLAWSKQKGTARTTEVYYGSGSPSSDWGPLLQQFNEGSARLKDWAKVGASTATG